MKKNKFRLSKTERRILIVLMFINLFAFFVNYFHLSPKFEMDDSYASHIGDDIAYIFTDSGSDHMLGQKGGYYLGQPMYSWRNTEAFWPLTKFYVEKIHSFEKKDYSASSEYSKEYYTESRFRGIFADYDHTEFIVYTILIFGVVYVRKLW